MSKNKTQEAQEKQDKRHQQEAPEGTARGDKNLMPQGDQRNAPTSGEQGGGNDPKGHSSPGSRAGELGGSGQAGSGQTGGKISSDFRTCITEIAAAVKELTESGVGGAAAANIALEVWKGCN